MITAIFLNLKFSLTMTNYISFGDKVKEVIQIAVNNGNKHIQQITYVFFYAMNIYFTHSHSEHVAMVYM